MTTMYVAHRASMDSSTDRNNVLSEPTVIAEVGQPVLIVLNNEEERLTADKYRFGMCPRSSACASFAAQAKWHSFGCHGCLHLPSNIEVESAPRTLREAFEVMAGRGLRKPTSPSIEERTVFPYLVGDEKMKLRVAFQRSKVSENPRWWTVACRSIRRRLWP